MTKGYLETIQHYLCSHHYCCVSKKILRLKICFKHMTLLTYFLCALLFVNIKERLHHMLVHTIFIFIYNTKIQLWVQTVLQRVKLFCCVKLVFSRNKSVAKYQVRNKEKGMLIWRVIKSLMGSVTLFHALWIQVYDKNKFENNIIDDCFQQYFLSRCFTNFHDSKNRKILNEFSTSSILFYSPPSP